MKNAYLQSVLETVAKRNPGEPEFIQAVTEVLEAYESGLVTLEIYNNYNYKRNITRGEFAHVMTEFLKQLKN